MTSSLHAALATGSDRDFHALATSLGHAIDPEAYRFGTAAEVVTFLSGFLTRPLSMFSAGQLLAQAAESHVPVAQLGDHTIGCRVPGHGGVALLALHKHDMTIFLRFSEQPGGGIHVYGWGTSARAVAELPVD